MAASLKMVLKMALLFIVIVGVMVGNTRGIETAQGIKDEMKYLYSTPIDFEVQASKCCVWEPICCRIGLRNLRT